MPFIRSHWFWLFAILTVVTGIDYWDHVSRPGSPFEEAPGAWFGFTAAVHISLCAIAFIAAKILCRLPIHRWPRARLIADTLGWASAIALHLLVTGPLWDQVFWDGQLRFNSVFGPVLFGSALYLFYRGFFAFIAHLRHNPPKSLP